MAMVQLEKLMLVNPFREKVEVDRKPEAVQKVEIVMDEAVELTMQQYAQVKHLESEILNNPLDIKLEALAPIQIQLVLAAISNMDNYINKKVISSGYTLNNVFISDLIQKSYKAGNNNFVLDAGDSQLSLLELKGMKNNLLYATIIGNAGDRLGYESENCTYNILGNVGDRCGFPYSQNCNYIISGDAIGSIGYKAQDCTFEVKGNIFQPDDIDYVGEYAQRSTFKISNLPRKLFNPYSIESKPRSCIFATESKEVYDGLKYYTLHGKPNKRRLVDKNNSILEEANI